MSTFTDLLNVDGGGLKTSARYDSNAATWLHDSAMYAKNASGIWTPVGPTSPLPTSEASGTGTFAAATHTTVSVATTSTQLIAANAVRLYLLIVNDSDTPIYLSLNGASAVGAGIRLNPGGGSFELSHKAGNLFTGAINAIHGATGTKNVLATEGV